ncbi:hypothetical protein [Nocardioides dongkuii]|uniref:hypothetical protein n=1 Tax=Nocardioides dongkuii TaxID=2760089 RepID=UPI0015F87392|nr:hypothetical protein [Nocardioides dongkuii]
MYFDNRPCDVCGSEVRLKAHDSSTPLRGPDPDGTVDERVCTNPDCASHEDGGPQA